MHLQQRDGPGTGQVQEGGQVGRVQGRGRITRPGIAAGAQDIPGNDDKATLTKSLFYPLDPFISFHFC